MHLRCRIRIKVDHNHILCSDLKECYRELPLFWPIFSLKFDWMIGKSTLILPPSNTIAI
ncbi:hypothetical protein [Rubritalea tangerina]|uniref:hypothetical protein n=1 Tax=Rubritalea tangerina TaxID=430798 RepID=UPI0036182647